MLTIGQNLLLNSRRWHIRQVQPLAGRAFSLEAIGASEAAQGMTRPMTAYLYGDDLFIEQRQPRLWHAHLGGDWRDDLYGPALQAQPATWLDLLAAHTRHPAQGDLKNDFSWSFSRANRYRHCPRAYYYHYYAAWEGWREEAPAPVKRAYLLKNLTDLPRWTGMLVHETLKFALARLKAGQPLEPGTLLKQMHRRAQVDFADSQAGRYRQQPNQVAGFQEHYYQNELAQAEWASAWQRAEQHVITFLTSPLYAYLRQQPPAAFLDVETLQSFSLANTKVWVQMDLACLEAGTLSIYDWKTGTLEDEARLRQQLGIYGLYFQHSRPELLAGHALRGVVYALAEDRLIEMELDQALLAETAAAATASITHLRGLLFDPTANLADLTAFPMIDDLRVCHTCQFRELCGRD